MKHLLSIADLERRHLERILEVAASFASVAGRDIKKVPTLRGRTVVNLFYESSTRTSSSFELAAKRLSADLISIRSAGSAVEKGESLKDTVATLSAYDPAVIVIRSPWAGAGRTSCKQRSPRCTPRCRATGCSSPRCTGSSRISPPRRSSS